MALRVVGFAGCPFHTEALGVADALLAEGLVPRVEGSTTATREQYKAWLASAEGPATTLGQNAARHTSSPICWIEAEGSGVPPRFIGGCDAITAYAATLRSGSDSGGAVAMSTKPRPELVAAHSNFWSKLVEPGTFFTGEERVQICSVARAARSCPLSRALAALATFDPTVHFGGYAVMEGCRLPAAVVDVIHRTVQDAGRVADSDAYYANVTVHVAPGAYVEVVALVATLTQIDTFAYAAGLPLAAMPEPPASHTAAPPPRQLAMGQACYPHVSRVPTVPLDSATHPITRMIYYGPSGKRPEGGPGSSSVYRTPNILKMLSAVPSDHLNFVLNVGSMYVTDLQPGKSGNRAISRAQIELLATKTSQLNDCAY